jgi:hypothetical protein
VAQPLVTRGIFGPTGMLRACDKAEKDTKKAVRGSLKKVGEVVRVPATEKLREIDEKSAAGLRTVVRQRGVSVEQSLRRTTGQHPSFGVLQMREVLEPALAENADEVEQVMGEAIDDVVDHFKD